MSLDLKMIFQNGATANGNGNVAGVNGLASYSMDLAGVTASGCTINFEGQCSDQATVPFGSGGTTPPGPIWRAIAADPVGAAAATAAVTTATSDGTWIIKCAGLSQIRARISGYSGAVPIYVQGYGSYMPRW